VPVAEASDLMDLIKLGNQRRIVANTGANRFSSRSHAILIFNIEGLSKDETETRFVRSKLQIVDLAGSERAASTENRG
jgi:kinesin family protein 18/19